MFPVVLKSLRNHKNMTQAETAELLGIDRSTYTKYESGGSTPSFDMLQKIADFFEVSIDYLLGRTDERRSASISNDEDWPSDVKVMMRDASKLNDEQKEIVRRLIKEFVNEKK